jgi:hypothetical protein
MHRAQIARVATIATAVCLVAQLVFWFELVPGYGLAIVPFIWAYAQYSTVEQLTMTYNAPVIAASWLGGYLLFGAVGAAWSIRSKHAFARGWRGALLANAVVQVVIGIAMAALFFGGVISME